MTVRANRDFFAYFLRHNDAGTKICTYTYDAWGVCTVSLASGITQVEQTIANTYNPFRYRGYFYDVESGYYYLQSRYYNPNWGRFLNADGQFNSGLLGYNMYAYCNNNPVNGCDPCGTCFHRRDFWNDCDKCGGTTIEEKIERRIRTVAIRKLPAIFVIVHYGRNFLNDIPNNTEDLEDKSKWISSEDGGPAADCHQFTSPDRSNVKYVSLDGHHEIIVDSSGQIVTDPMDVGTYNFIPSDKNGIFGVIGHALVDVLPWIFLGNSIDDTTTIFDRIGSLLGG